MPDPNYTYAELEGLWIAAGGDATHAPVAAAIAEAESGGCRYALAGPVDVRPVPICKYTATNGEDSHGLWQINVRAHPQYATVDLFDPLVNATAAVSVSNNGVSFQPWSTFEDRAYLPFVRQGVPPVAPAPPPLTSGGTSGDAGSLNANQVLSHVGNAAGYDLPAQLVNAVGAAKRFVSAVR